MGLDTLIAKVNWVDVLVLILLIRISYRGFIRGFSSEILPLLGTFLLLIISLHNYAFIGQLVSAYTPLTRPISNLIAFSILTGIVIFLFNMATKIIQKMVRVEVISFVQHAGGLILGFIRASLTISLVLIFLVLIPIRYLDSSIKDRSVLGMKFLKIGPVIHDSLIGVSGEEGAYEHGCMERRFAVEHWRE